MLYWTLRKIKPYPAYHSTGEKDRYAIAIIRWIRSQNSSGDPVYWEYREERVDFYLRSRGRLFGEGDIWAGLET